MRIDNDIPWWSSKWFAFTFAFVVLCFICAIHRKHDFVGDLILIFGAPYIFGNIRNVFVLRLRGKVLFFFGIALFLCAEMLSVFVIVTIHSYFLVYAVYLISFFLIYYVRNYADGNKARWFIMRRSYPDCLEYHEDIPFVSFLGESALVEIPMKRTREDTQFIVLSDFDSGFTKSKAIKEDRREVVTERLKEFCSREGIEVIES